MKHSVKLYLKRWAISYAIINIILLIICFAVKNRLNISIPYYKVSIGAIIIAICISLSITLFKMKKGNQIIKTILGLLALAPIVFITRRIFGVTVFRYSFVIYIFAGICAISYVVAVFVVAKKAKIEENELNNLLHSKENQINKDDDN